MLFFDKSAALPDIGSSYGVLIADVHLSEGKDRLEQLFTDFLASSVVRHAERLVILGNLFDTWIGDDELSNSWSARIALKISSLSRMNVAVSIMGGNHDFLLGKRFCAETNSVYLDDPSLMDLYGVATVLSHGDSLCTDDFEYQTFRKSVRQPSWQRDFLSQTMEARRAIGQKLRDENLKRSRCKPNDYLNVCNQSVLKLLADTKAKRMIHGHVPGSGIYNHLFEGHVIQRWVLPEWKAGSDKVCGGALIVNHKACFPLCFSLQAASMPAYT